MKKNRNKLNKDGQLNPTNHSPFAVEIRGTSNSANIKNLDTSLIVEHANKLSRRFRFGGDKLKVPFWSNIDIKSLAWTKNKDSRVISVKVGSKKGMTFLTSSETLTQTKIETKIGEQFVPVYFVSRGKKIRVDKQ